MTEIKLNWIYMRFWKKIRDISKLIVKYNCTTIFIQEDSVGSNQTVTDPYMGES